MKFTEFEITVKFLSNVNRKFVDCEKKIFFEILFSLINCKYCYNFEKFFENGCFDKTTEVTNG